MTNTESTLLWFEIVVAIGATAAVAVVAAASWIRAGHALRATERTRQDTLRPVVVPESLRWVRAGDPTLSQLRMSTRNDGTGPAVNFVIRVEHNGKVGENGHGGGYVFPAHAPSNDRLVAQGSDWQAAFENGADFVLEYQDVFGNAFRTDAHWDGKWFTRVILSEVAQ